MEVNTTQPSTNSNNRSETEKPAPTKQEPKSDSTTQDSASQASSNDLKYSLPGGTAQTAKDIEILRKANLNDLKDLDLEKYKKYGGAYNITNDFYIAKAGKQEFAIFKGTNGRSGFKANESESVTGWLSSTDAMKNAIKDYESKNPSKVTVASKEAVDKFNVNSEGASLYSGDDDPNQLWIDKKEGQDLVAYKHENGSIEKYQMPTQFNKAIEGLNQKQDLNKSTPNIVPASNSKSETTAEGILEKLNSMPNLKIYKNNTINKDNFHNLFGNSESRRSLSAKSTLATGEDRESVLQALTDSLSKEPEIEKMLQELAKKNINIYVTDGMGRWNTTSGGSTLSFENGIEMALPSNVNYEDHAKVYRHEFSHVKDSLLAQTVREQIGPEEFAAHDADGLYVDEVGNKANKLKILMQAAITQSANSDDIDLKYGSEWFRIAIEKKDMSSSSRAFTETRAVLETLYAADPVGFRNRGNNFEWLADYFQNRVLTFDESLIGREMKKQPQIASD